MIVAGLDVNLVEMLPLRCDLFLINKILLFAVQREKKNFRTSNFVKVRRTRKLALIQEKCRFVHHTVGHQLSAVYLSGNWLEHPFSAA